MSDTAAIILPRAWSSQPMGCESALLKAAAKGFVAFHSISDHFEETLDGVFTGLYTYVHVHRQMNIPNWYSTTGIFKI